MTCSKAWPRLDGCARRVLKQWVERGIGGGSIPSFSLSVMQKVQKAQEAGKPTGKLKWVSAVAALPAGLVVRQL
jgi:hypothetical protein